MSGNQMAAHLVIYKALSSPFSQLPLYRPNVPLLVKSVIPAYLGLPQS
ncbi:hypothetical protein E2C01_023366 [Portunus trituberculatus]|uniref:Uncharacterized protein n=1 Tax=Portunus trituberculatus TaxID=210409 RepID=A0A5B7E7T1_PORTR|nr:hypothetical protein [Portunus trituberculatus]